MAQGGQVRLPDLREVPAAWPLQTVLDAWVHLNAHWGESGTQTANAALEPRLEELWAAEPEAAARCLKLEPSEGPRAEALSRYGRAERERCHVRCFTAQGLVRQERSPGVQSYFDVRCRELARRLAAAEAKAGEAKRRRLEESASSASRELQAAKEETARNQLRCEELTSRVAELEAAASEKSMELQAVHEERARLADRLGEAEAEVRAAQDEAAKHKDQHRQLEARVLALEAEKAAQLQASEEQRRQLAERLAAAEALVLAKTAELDMAKVEISKQAVQIDQLVQQVSGAQRLAAESQGELRKTQEELPRALAKDEAGKRVDLQTFLIDKIQALSEEKGKYKERCDQLQLQLTEAKKPTGPRAHLSDERSSLCSEESWVHLSEAGSGALTESCTSGISVDTAGPHCFMVDATFKAEGGILVPAKDLSQGSRILAADGTVVEVAAPPEQHQAMRHRFDHVDLIVHIRDQHIHPHNPARYPSICSNITLNDASIACAHL